MAITFDGDRLEGESQEQGLEPSTVIEDSHAPPVLVTEGGHGTFGGFHGVGVLLESVLQLEPTETVKHPSSAVDGA